MIIQLTSEDVKADPNLIWNEYIGLIARDYRDLEARQRPAHLVFIYESEVQNGGHLQYFENVGTGRLEDTIDALEQLGANGQAQVLREAGSAYAIPSRVRIKTIEEFVAAELEGEFSGYDERFHECAPPLIECLETHLSLHLDCFVCIR
jgi:Domain of unknown function (DUF4375)